MPVETATPAPMTLKTPLGTDLAFKGMSATEHLGQLFEFDVEALSDDGSIRPEELLGKPASVALEMPGDEKRYFHGLVCAMGTSGTAGNRNRLFGYRLILRPWLWLLTRRTDTRIFQSQTVVDILKKVFEPFSPEVDFQVKGAFPKYDYCVQYRETDFNFVSRLMEQEGIYYYFTHEADRHTMVIVNTPSAHRASPWGETFLFRDNADAQLDFAPIVQWRTTKEIQPTKVVLRDYDFQKPDVNLETKADATREGASMVLEHYDYPGDYVDRSGGERYSKLRIEELQARYSRVHGAGPLRGMVCGTRFTLEEHPRDDQNREHLVLSTRTQMAFSGYESSEDTTFCQCQFTAMDANELYRPPRTTPKPFVSGLHTAIVVGPAGDEIYTDEHGRVKVQFHWDRLGKKDHQSSCWVRVSSPWAGQNWGMISLPRIGQEVVVDFLEGDADRPIITGRVYNGNQKPPYALPDNATVSTARSRSSKGGDASSANEIRFEDKKGSEYLWLQAEKDFHQIVKHDATIDIANNQDGIIGNDWTQQVEGHVKYKIAKDWVTDVQGSTSLKVSKDIMTEGGATISQKSSANFDVKAGGNLAIDAGGTVHVKSGASLVIEAGVMITVKAGGSSVVIGPSGVSITGTMVMINSGGAPGAGSGASPKAALPAKDPFKKADPLA